MMISTITSITKPAAMTKPTIRNTDMVGMLVSAASAARILSGK